MLLEIDDYYCFLTMLDLYLHQCDEEPCQVCYLKIDILSIKGAVCRIQVT